MTGEQPPTRSSNPVFRRMGQAALIVSAGVLLSRILGLVREQVVAALLGATADGDVYQATFSIPDFTNYLLAGGFMSITFIPIFSRYLADNDEQGGWRAFTAVGTVVGIAMSVLIVVGMVVARPVLEALYPDFTDEQIAETTRLTRIILPAQLFFILGSLLMAVQYAKGVFTIPTLAPIIYNLGIITGGVAYNLVTGEASPEGFALGVVVGAAVGNFVVQYWGARRVGMVLPPDSGWRHPAVKEYILLAIPLMVGQSLVVLDEQFMKSFGNLVGEGAPVQLQVARRTMFVPVGIIAQAAGVAAYPFLARQFAEGKLAEMARTVQHALKWVVVLSLGAAAVLAVLSIPIIRALFERGKFEPADTVASAAALLIYGLAIPAWGVLSVVTRGFYARREMWTPVIVGTLATLAAFPIYFGLERAWGIRGVAAASALTLTGYTIALAAIWYRRTGTGYLRPVLASAMRALPLAVVAGLAGWLAADLAGNLVAPDGLAGALIAIAAGGTAFVAVALVAGARLGDRTRPRREA